MKLDITGDAVHVDMSLKYFFLSAVLVIGGIGDCAMSVLRGCRWVLKLFVEWRLSKL